ncbi:MAG: BlaI/MecI/CopY family transcriptional regulator [Prevotella sp.]|jgi:predicted transcriptional regulator|nr:BlaI/MecI/CopY family transcriptional regulator [Prevotella sp.]
MIKLTAKEEEVMEKIWQIGNCAPKDVLALYEEPKPHINTIATMFQMLEKKGYLTHEAKGRGYIYSPIVAQNDYGKSKFSSFVDRYFDHDYMKVVSTLVSDEKVSREELLQFLDELKSQS